jgi:hypothetical protein
MAKLAFLVLIAAIAFSMREEIGAGPLVWIYWLLAQMGGVALFLLTVVIFLSCAFIAVRKFNSLVKAFETLVLILSPFVAVTFVQAGVFAVKDVMRKRTTSVPVVTMKEEIVPNQLSRRVIWIIFDEMDHRLSFIDRPDYVHLPEFDRLRQEGLYALHAYPPSSNTMLSLPALLTGRLVSKGWPVGPDNLQITYLDEEEPVSWKDQPNVFSRAREMSRNAAGGGYGHPYCRLFGDMLTSCYSYSHWHFEWKGNSENRLLDVLLAQIFPLVPIRDRYTHRRDYLRMLNYAKKVAVDEKINLVFLHFGIPHRPYIYDVDEEKFSIFYDFFSTPSGKGYFSNLVLADITLGEIRKALQSAGLWEETTLIVSSDHFIRPEINTFDDKEDRRVPFLLKLSQQNEAIIYEPEFNTVVTCDLVLTILGGRLSTISDLVNWLNEHRNSQPILGAMNNS